MREGQRIIILSPAWRIACIVLNLLPVPGVGAMIAGARNPHTRLLPAGIAQAMLVVFGAWPLIIPGVAGFLWAAWSAWTIAKYARPAPDWSRPVKVAP